MTKKYKDYHVHNDYYDSPNCLMIQENYRENMGGVFVEHRFGFEPITHYIMVEDCVIWIGSLTACNKMCDRIDKGDHLPPNMLNFLLH